MADVKSTLTQLIKAFKIHGNNSIASKEEISHLLLLFYAVECGLKAKYLKEFNGNSTSDFESLLAKKYGHGHNIWQWVIELKMPNMGFKNDNNRPISQMHERLRYGSYNETALEISQKNFLKSITAVLKKEL